MADKNQEKLGSMKQTVTDDQIVSERKLGRRSFLTAVGALVAGGAAALALGNRLDASGKALGQRSDPDQKKRTDPDQKKKKMTKATKKKGPASKSKPKKTSHSDPDHAARY